MIVSLTTTFCYNKWKEKQYESDKGMERRKHGMKI
jgi:hypothetical protein